MATSESSLQVAAKSGEVGAGACGDLKVLVGSIEIFEKGEDFILEFYAINVFHYNKNCIAGFFNSMNCSNIRMI